MIIDAMVKAGIIENEIPSDRTNPQKTKKTPGSKSL